MTGGTNPVATYGISNYTIQNPAAYKASIDGNSRVAQRIVDSFAPHEQATPVMTIALDAGATYTYTGLTEVAAQNTGTITALDRVVCDFITGILTTVTGAENTSPVPPAIPSGKFPVAQIALATSTTAITNNLITDERINNMVVFSLPAVTVTSSSNAITLNLQAARIFSWTTTEAATVTISNPDATGIKQSFEIWLFQDSTGRVVTWPGSVKWSNGIAPTLNIANAKYTIGFSSIDGGTTWIGVLSAEAYA